MGSIIQFPNKIKGRRTRANIRSKRLAVRALRIFYEFLPHWNRLTFTTSRLAASLGNERLGLEIEIYCLMWQSIILTTGHVQSVDVIKCGGTNNYYCALNTLIPSGRLCTHGALTG